MDVNEGNRASTEHQGRTTEVQSSLKSETQHDCNRLEMPRDVVMLLVVVVVIGHRFGRCRRRLLMKGKIESRKGESVKKNGWGADDQICYFYTQSTHARIQAEREGACHHYHFNRLLE